MRASNEFYRCRPCAPYFSSILGFFGPNKSVYTGPDIAGSAEVSGEGSRKLRQLCTKSSVCDGSRLIPSGSDPAGTVPVACATKYS